MRLFFLVTHSELFSNHEFCFYFICITDTDKQTEEMFILLVKELAENENVTEQLKAENQMLWMHQMNNIHNRVIEIINTDLIYV